MQLWFHLGVDAHLQGKGEGRKEQPPALLLCAAHPLHSLAHRVAGLKMVSLAILGSLCQQRHVDTATAVICSVVLAPAVGLRFSKAELKVWVNAGGCYGASIGL